MNRRHIAFAILLSTFALHRLLAYIDVYFTSYPSQVASGENYYVEAATNGGYSGSDISLSKNGSYLSGNSGWGYLTVGEWNSDSGPQTITYMADATDWDYYETAVDYAYVQVNAVPNQPPVATIEVDGYSSGATITRPYGGSVTVTVRYKATDGNGNLSGIRPQVWYPNGSLNNNGGNFVAQSGSSGEVTWSVTLNEDGDWYFWTDAQDPTIAPSYVDSGSWGNGFRLHVVQAPPPNSPPTASVWANVSSLYTGQTALIYVRGQDSDGNARYFNLDQVSPLNCFYGPGDNFVSSQQPNNGWWDLGSNTGDYTRTVNMTFDRPGNYVWRGAVMDSAGSGWQYSPTNHTISVPNRDPSVSITILDGSQNPIALNGNGRAPVQTNTNFYIRVSGSDPDGRLARLYSRINNPSGVGYAYEQHDVSGGSATWTFGPYNPGSTTGVWDVWGHAEDQDNGGYQWQGGGWWGTQSPDIEVYQPNTAPTGSWQTLPGTIVPGATFTARASGHDNDGNLTTVWVDLSTNGGAWSAFAYNGGGNGFDNTSDGNLVTAGAVGTTYQFRYYVADSAGANTGWQYSGVYTVTAPPDTTAPSVPSGLGSSSVTTTSFTLTWSASSDNVSVTAYEVQRDTTSLGTTSALSLGLSGLSPNTTYAMTVRARDAAGNWSAWSSALNVTTASLADTTAPSVPTGLASSNVGSAGFTLTWTASTDNVGVTQYEIFKNGVSYTTSTALTSNITGLSPATTYPMTVRARDAAGNWSAQSTALNVTTSSAPIGMVDTDLDGMSDDWEVYFGLNPNSAADASLDNDGDGRTNLQEYVAHTNPRNAADKVATISTGHDLVISTPAGFYGVMKSSGSLTTVTAP
jgi:chitodextrinase